MQFILSSVSGKWVSLWGTFVALQVNDNNKLLAKYYCHIFNYPLLISLHPN